jgi:hypothetical protein
VPSAGDPAKPAAPKQVPAAARAAAAAVIAAGAKPAPKPTVAASGPATPQPSAAAVAARQQAKPAAGAQPSAASNGTQPALSNADVQRIYSNYVAARKQNSERVDNVKLDSIEKTLRGMLPGLEKKHAGKKIDFEVVVKDGKVALKPVAK